jgi:hypothetical protein
VLPAGRPPDVAHRLLWILRIAAPLPISSLLLAQFTRAKSLFFLFFTRADGEYQTESSILVLTRTLCWFR